MRPTAPLMRLLRKAFPCFVHPTGSQYPVKGLLFVVGRGDQLMLRGRAVNSSFRCCVLRHCASTAPSSSAPLGMDSTAADAAAAKRKSKMLWGLLKMTPIMFVTGFFGQAFGIRTGLYEYAAEKKFQRALQSATFKVEFRRNLKIWELEDRVRLKERSGSR